MTALEIKDVLREEPISEAILKNNLPLMRTWHGALDAYILALFFCFSPVGVVSMRFMAIFFGTLIISLTYFVMKELLNRNYAILSVLLVVINPSFIMGTKLGVDNGTIMATIYMLILFCLLKWYRLKNHIYFYFSMFLLGLGMWTRIWFFGLFLDYYLLL